VDVGSTQYSVTARFPAGTEYWYTERIPRVGTQLVHCGEEYEVISYERVGGARFVLHLATAESRAQPLTRPTREEGAAPTPASSSRRVAVG
jgi:hypothetical protein